MPDPVSWHLVRKGWAVVDAAGEKVGTVAEVLGDPERDIFSGLAVGSGLLGPNRYLPAERVSRIEEGFVHVDLGPGGVEGLPAHRG